MPILGIDPNFNDVIDGMIVISLNLLLGNRATSSCLIII